MMNDPFVHMQADVFQSGRLLESCDGDAELAGDVVADFLDTAPRLLARLAQAVTDGDAIHTRLEAHSLKGSAQTLGAEALAAAGQALEEEAKRGELSQAPCLLARIEGEFRRALPRLQEYLGGCPRGLQRAA